MRERFISLWNILLDQDDGVSEQTYNALVELGDSICPDFVRRNTRFVDATDGRFYIKSEDCGG